MSQDFVTHAQLQQARLEIESLFEEHRVTFEKKLEAQLQAFESEIRKSFARNLEEARDGRVLLIDSNDKMVLAFNRAQERADRAESGSDRHRASTALAIKSIDDGFKALAYEMVLAVKDLGKQIQEVKQAVEARGAQ